MQKVRHIAQNTDHSMQNDGRTKRNVGRNTLNVCQGPKGGLEVSPRGLPYLEKTLSV